MPPDPRPAPSPWIAFSAVAIGNFMAPLDGSIVNVALPTLGAGFGAPIDRLEWIVSAYLLAISATLLAAGRLGDVLGHRPVYVGGLAAFSLGSALCGLSAGLSGLVAARVLQAFGAAAMMAIGPAIVTDVFPPRMRGQALGSIGSVVSLGLVSGPPIGGAILQHLSWRWLFFVNVPVGVLGIVWGLRSIPRRRAAGAGALDVPGAALLAATLATALGAVDLAPTRGATAVALAVAAAASGVGLAARVRRAPHPIVDLRLFDDRTFAAGVAAGFLSYVAMFSQTLLTPFYLARAKELGPGALGLMLSAVPLAMAVSSPVAGWIADRLGGRALPVVGMASLAAGLGTLSLAGPDDGLPSVAARLALCGLGMGLFQAPNNAAVMGAVPPARLGSGGGILATARNVGMAVGVAVSASLLAWRAGEASSDLAGFLAGYALALRAGAGIAIAAGAVSLLAPRRSAAPG